MTMSEKQKAYVPTSFFFFWPEKETYMYKTEAVTYLKLTFRNKEHYTELVILHVVILHNAS